VGKPLSRSKQVARSILPALDDMVLVLSEAVSTDQPPRSGSMPEARDQSVAGLLRSDQRVGVDWAALQMRVNLLGSLVADLSE
jgi:hypothetical protein